MSAPAAALGVGLVGLVRDYLLVHRSLRHVAERFRSGRLSFEELQGLVSDASDSPLFRLKERCHALFRDVGDGRDVRREALFDLAVGALFHEAMKFRENFYQQSVYGPRLQALRRAAGAGESERFDALERILEASAVRLEESLREAELLLRQTTVEFEALLAAHRANGLVARTLLENPAAVADVFGADCAEVLARIHGTVAEAYALAGRSYLDSGRFAEAARALAAARERGGEGFDRDLAYARGMDAYLAADYGRAVEGLRSWFESGLAQDDAPRVDLAHAAISRVGSLVQGEAAGPVVAAAAELARELRPHSPRARSQAGPVV